MNLLMDVNTNVNTTISTICKELSNTISKNNKLTNVSLLCLVKKISVYPYLIYIDIVDCDNVATMQATLETKFYNNDITINDKLLIKGKIEFYKNVTLRIRTYEHDVPVISNYETIYKMLVDNNIMQIPKKKIEKIRNIAVISSNNAAGLKDFLDVITQTSINNVYIIPVILQGNYMEKSVLDALLKTLTMEIDAIIIIRGGGSRSDLEWFDNYNIAVKIKLLSVVTICGIGHEIDHSIIDDVADYSFNTPTQVSYFIKETLTKQNEKLNKINSLFRRKVNDTIEKCEKINQIIVNKNQLRITQMNSILHIYENNIEKLINIINIDYEQIIFEHIELMQSKVKQCSYQLLTLGHSINNTIDGLLQLCIVDNNGTVIKTKKAFIEARNNGCTFEIHFIDGKVYL